MSPHIQACIAEFVGTTILLILGNGVVANMLLRDTKGNGNGWMGITAGWGLAVYVGVLCSEKASGAHLNPAVTIGLASAGTFEWSHAGGYIAAQMLGAMVGATISYFFYYSHYQITEDPNKVLGTFCTAPAIRHSALNLFSEAVATFVLVFAVLMTRDPEVAVGAVQNGGEPTTLKVGLGSLGAIRVGLVVFAIGLCIGGTSGYAINPARDLGPRIVHFLLPIPNKRDSDWGYAWIPVIGPILGGLLAAGLYLALGSLPPT